MVGKGRLVSKRSLEAAVGVRGNAVVGRTRMQKDSAKREGDEETGGWRRIQPRRLWGARKVGVERRRRGRALSRWGVGEE